MPACAAPAAGAQLLADYLSSTAAWLRLWSSTRTSGRGTSWLCWLASSPSPHSPRTSSRKGAAFLGNRASQHGQVPPPDVEVVEQAPQLRLLQSLLGSARTRVQKPWTPAAQACDRGYLQRTPRTPAAFNEKERWR